MGREDGALDFSAVFYDFGIVVGIEAKLQGLGGEDGIEGASEGYVKFYVSDTWDRKLLVAEVDERRDISECGLCHFSV